MCPAVKKTNSAAKKTAKKTARKKPPAGKGTPAPPPKRLKSAQQLIGRFNYTKTFSPVAIQVNKLASSESTTMKEFEEVIELDPVLVYRLLRMINSAFFGLVKPVDTIPRAVAYLGMKAIRNLVAVDSLKQLFMEDNARKGFSRKNLWFHSATVATLAQMIATRIFGQEGDDVFMAGIMHDIGLVVEDQVEGELLRQSCKEYLNDKSNKSITYFEEEIIGTHHGKVGALLVEGWDISWDMYNAIKLHHDDTSDQLLSSTTCIIQIADFFANRLNSANVPGRYPVLPSKHLIEHTREMISDYEKLSKDLPKELARAQDLYALY